MAEESEGAAPLRALESPAQTSEYRADSSRSCLSKSAMRSSISAVPSTLSERESLSATSSPTVEQECFFSREYSRDIRSSTAESLSGERSTFARKEASSDSMSSRSSRADSRRETSSESPGRNCTTLSSCFWASLRDAATPSRSPSEGETASEAAESPSIICSALERPLCSSSSDSSSPSTRRAASS